MVEAAIEIMTLF